ncbi:MAG: lipoprotein [Oscillospiraceae bacterium]|nr:lipoprotein [Oscillospiraceae bacterium]
MKKLLLPLLLVLLLTGCQSLYPDDDLFVSEHVAPFAYRETEQPAEETSGVELIQSVSCASDIRDAIKRMLNRGEGSSTFLLKDYDGAVNEDMKNMYFALRDDSPKYAYAMEGPPTWNLVQDGTDTLIKISLNIQKDVKAIHTRLYKNKEAFEEEVLTVLRQQGRSFTVQVSGYQDTDWYTLLDDYILNHPDQIVEAPSISVYVFPDRGMVRVLELHFDYNTDQETLVQRKNDTNSYLNLICNQLSRKSPEEMVEVLARYLIPATGYEADPNASVYSQVVLKSAGSSRTMASVIAYLCNRAGVACEIVIGEREEEPWYWNRILCDDGWRSLDLHAAALEGNFHPALLPSAEMIGYSWDPLRYLEIEPPEPEEPSEPEEPIDPDAPTETAEQTEPVEDSEAPQPEPEPSTEPSTEASTEEP